MSIEQKRVYKLDKKKMFNLMKDALIGSRFALKSYDETVGKITVSTPPSLFSYGENIEIIVSPQGNGGTVIYIKADPKAFFNLTARASVRKDIEDIFLLLDEKISQELS